MPVCTSFIANSLVQEITRERRLMDSIMPKTSREVEIFSFLAKTTHRTIRRSLHLSHFLFFFSLSFFFLAFSWTYRHCAYLTVFANKHVLKLRKCRNALGFVERLNAAARRSRLKFCAFAGIHKRGSYNEKLQKKNTELNVSRKDNPRV